MLTSGALVHGRYRIVRQVGRGGMGVVHEAVDARLRCQVALKELRATGGQADAAFEHEAQLLAALRHPALPVVMDFFTEADRQYLVMQFIPGEDLGSALAKRDAGFGLADVLGWLDRLFSALEFLHGHRPPILHRDIKPGNLKLTPGGEIVLLDFGLAKGSPHAGSGAWDPSILGYTPRYSPLEQVDGSGTDARSDLYALGATAYHLLTGVPPPNAIERATASLNRRGDPLRDAHGVSAAVPEAVAAVLARALALGRDERFESARAMRSALRDAVAGHAAGAGRQRTEARPRRLDAAAPAQAQVGTRIDLLVQVRFADSPRLGLEDWPNRRRPSAIEQVSEVVRLAFPVNPATGEICPARLHVKVVAPDFAVEGQASQLIDVPPDAYSQRVAFLLMATREGVCRLTVEVYAADAVYLGSAPVETEVCAGPIDAPRTRVTDLHLAVVGRDDAGMSPTSNVSPTAPTKVAPPLAQWAPQDASGRRPSPVPASQPPRQLEPPPKSASRPGATRRGRLARILAPAAAVVLTTVAGLVYYANAPRTSPLPPAMAPSPATPGAPAPSPPGAASLPPAMPSPGSSPRGASAPAMPPGLAPAPAPITARSRSVSVGDAMRSLNVREVTLRIVSARRRDDDALVLQLRFNNDGPRQTGVRVDYRASEVLDEAGRRVGVFGRGEAGFSAVIPPGGEVRHTIVAATGASAATRVRFFVGGSAWDPSSAAFEPFDLVLK